MKFTMISAACFLACASLLSGGEPTKAIEPKLYVSFDQGGKPETAAPGVGLRTAGELQTVEGKFGKAVHFSRNDKSGDLLYSLGKTMGKDWTIAFWVKLDEAGNTHYGSKEPGRFLFRTGLGWGRGNVMAGIDNWGHFTLTHFDAAGKYLGQTMSASVLTGKEWVYLAFTCKDGKHATYINGIEATYSKDQDVVEAGPAQDVLRIGSLDTKNNQMEGAVDELKVFDRALSADEVKQLMNTIPGNPEVSQVLLYDPFSGEIAPRGAASFNASELVFDRNGVKIVRHGYDRRGQLSLNGVPGLVRGGLTVGFLLIPGWNGSDDNRERGFFFVRAGEIRYDLTKNADKVTFSLRSGAADVASVSLPASLLKKDQSIVISAGLNSKKGVLFLSIGDRREESRITFPPEFSNASGSIGLGDLAENDVYSKGQIDGSFSDFLVAAAPLSSAETETLLQFERKCWSERQKKDTVPLLPVQAKEIPLWNLNGAEKVATATRERITMNALWRFQLTDADHPFSIDDWEYLAVPGRFSGQGNGMTDCEFYRRDANLNQLPRDAKYRGKSSYQYVNGWFERSFRAVPAWKNRKIVLLIDELSGSQKGTVFLNGVKLAELPVGGNYFQIILPPKALRFDEENHLTIHTVDAGQYWAWRGIKGDVALLVKPLFSANDPAIIPSLKSRNITFELTLKNDSGKSQTVIPQARITGKRAPGEIEGGAVTLAPGETRRISFHGDWSDPELWSPDNPYLYTAQLEVKNPDGTAVDGLEPVQFGFREFEIRGKDYYLNGHSIHLFTHDGWANSTSDEAEARRVARTLKKLGFNSVRTLFPADAKDSDPNTIMQICDEEGLLQFVGLDGVTGREFSTWNDPAVKRNLEEKMAARIRQFRNHPSNVMYFLSTNFLGYGWDYHPLKMADGYLPNYLKRQYEICMEGVEIMRKYDSVRPYFFQAGGNFGPVINSNAYFCWWPQAERNAWPEVWSKIGKKPLDIIETSFPYLQSFCGMDLRYGQPRPLFYYENLARYYGPEVYLDNDPDMLKMTERSTAGNSQCPYYDSPYFQKLKSDLLRETIPFWRGFGISGISPFDELSFAFRTNAPNHSSHVAKSWEVKADEFRRFGWTPDLRKFQYQSDIDPDRPLPVAEALADALAPRLVFFDGGAKSPTDLRRNYFGGETLQKGIALINDTQSKADFNIDWQLKDSAGKPVASGKVTKTLTPGEIVRCPISADLPEVTTRSEFQLVSPQVKQPLEITVFPHPSPVESAGIALYDEKGMTAKLLQKIAPRVRNAQTLANLDGITLLVIGRESLTPNFAAFAQTRKLAERVDSGKLNVLICEQLPEAQAGLGMRTKAVYARNCFPTPALKIAGLQFADYSDWAGDGTIAPSHLPPDQSTEGGVASPLWHWSNLNMVAAYPFLRPTEGAFRVLLSCGMDLSYTPLLEMRSGDGSIVFSQLELSGRTVDDPAAEILFAGLLRRYSTLNPQSPRMEFLAPKHLAEDELGSILQTVKNGATLLAPPESYKLFGLRGKPEPVNRFALTPEGMKLWPDFTARDGFLRAPQKLTVLEGNDLIPLTVPAFAAKRKLGKGEILFLEIPADPQAEEQARGLKEGKDSSVLWSAEILAGRFLQMKNRLCAGNGSAFPSLARRLEHPEENPAIDLDGRWELQVGTSPKMEQVTVPGYYNQELLLAKPFVGVAIYRKTVHLPDAWQGKELTLQIGAIDDLDETFVNGVKIGATGEDTPGYWSAPRNYQIPAKLTGSGELKIVVNVDNLRGNAGITGHVRLKLARDQRKAPDHYPYGGISGTYDTESHIRW